MSLEEKGLKKKSRLVRIGDWEFGGEKEAKKGRVAVLSGKGAVCGLQCCREMRRAHLVAWSHE